ncbi:hypothetical protein G6F60_015076 [Rhizopus arrhizus]|nr:hypothetical protein G6F60_015076 [Rhizopus arrhizus]
MAAAGGSRHRCQAGATAADGCAAAGRSGASSTDCHSRRNSRRSRRSTGNHSLTAAPATADIVVGGAAGQGQHQATGKHQAHFHGGSPQRTGVQSASCAGIESALNSAGQDEWR